MGRLHGRQLLAGKKGHVRNVGGVYIMGSACSGRVQRCLLDMLQEGPHRLSRRRVLRKQRHHVRVGGMFKGGRKAFGWSWGLMEGRNRGGHPTVWAG